ncbi:MAG: L-glutamate gamma-semialdehyde dehydrogenase [Deltaproteobacteria bacterium]|nr:L-glutamate gamma-semialdehyde dehydrogenase [Deltaproteobacteria bacterium]
MDNTIAAPPAPRNEPPLEFAPASPERLGLSRALEALSRGPTDVPARIDDRAVVEGESRGEQRVPHRHEQLAARFPLLGDAAVGSAIDGALRAHRAWAAARWEDRAAIFLRAADLATGRRRFLLDAATMLGQGKTVFQAEIDAVCEMADFWRIQVPLLARILADQPPGSPHEWTRMDYRPLEGFVLAVSPFNFTAIAGNLSTAPLLLGNVVVWKPGSDAVLAAHFVHEILREAGLPPGVLQFVPATGETVARSALHHPALAGVHFTGSTDTFRGIWKQVGENVDRYRSFPRLVGETGGKGFVFAFPDADPDALRVALIRGAYEYQGQKCSAASRAYLPKSLWDRLRPRLVEEIQSIPMGDVEDLRNFMGAVINRQAFERLRDRIERARTDPAVSIVAGGQTDGRVGWFVRPTLIRTSDPKHALMQEELFGPVLTLFVYDDHSEEDALELCAGTSPYALTGAVFGADRRRLRLAEDRLRWSAGNFYLNDKPTGAVVGRQPFGGGRASGTNDKGGSLLNLLRRAGARTIKENLSPPTEWSYPHMRTE